jgi:hypothetical protein
VRKEFRSFKHSTVGYDRYRRYQSLSSVPMGTVNFYCGVAQASVRGTARIQQGKEVSEAR